MSLTVNNISFKGNNNYDDRRVRATEVGVGAGATIGGVKYGAGAFNRFKNAKNVVRLSGEATQQIKEAANAGKQVKSLWGKMFSNAKAYKNGIINWCKSTKMAKFMKPVFESKAFAKASGVVGGITAMFVFISGLGEMGNTYSKLANKSA